MTTKAQIDPNTAGFTLIELSIVLVIIGLIVGGIFVGLDLIAAAQIRGTVSQVEKYNSAVNTFRIKYNGLPGDLLESYASAFGLFTLTTGGAGQGDGNGLIEGGGSGLMVPAGETLAFWRHLSDAGLIDGAFGSSGNGAILPATGLVTANNTAVNTSLPPTKVTPIQYFIVYSESGLNYFQIMPVSQVSTPAGYNFSTSGISPIQAYDIDIKLDDGKPNGGSVIAKGIAAVDANASWLSSSTANTCLSNGADATDPASLYNRVAATGGNDPSCSVRFRFN